MVCPVCQNPETQPQALHAHDRLFEATSRTFSLTACARCRCLFIDPLPTGRELASFYPPNYWWKSSSAWLNALESAYRRIILRDHIACVMAAASNIATVKGPLRLLDVGCGNGTLLKLLQRRGFDVFGYESSDEAARIANDEGVNVVSGETLETAEFGAASLDIVTLFHVMEHVPEPRAILAEVRRILRPSGRILVQVPNIESWQSKLCGARWYGLDVPRHIINYSSYSIRRLLLDCGFRIRRVRHFNLRDNAAAFASSISPGLDPMSRCVRASRHRRREPAPVAWAKHAVYVALVAAVYPLVVAESVCGAGGTLMLEAEKA